MSSFTRDDGRGDDVSLSQVVAAIWTRKWIVIVTTCVAMIGSVGFALVRQPTYAATSTIMPLSNSNQSSSLAQYAGIASSLGFSLPAATVGGAPSQEIMAILQSRTLSAELVKALNLVPVVMKHVKPTGLRSPQLIVSEYVQKHVLAASEDKKSGVISITAKFFDPQISEKIANKAVGVLEGILNQRNSSLSRLSAQSLEQQITSQGKKVRVLQTQLASFQKDTKIISPQGQVTNAMNLYGTLLQQKLTLEVELSRLQNALSSDNPRVTEAKAQLDAVDKQISKLEGTAGVGSFSMGNAPEQIVKYENITTELDIAEKIYASLLAAYENQKLQQAQNQVFVQVIDPAIVPVLPSKPSKKVILITGTSVGIVVGILIALLVSGLLRLQQEVRAELSREDRR